MRAAFIFYYPETDPLTSDRTPIKVMFPFQALAAIFFTGANHFNRYNRKVWHFFLNSLADVGRNFDDRLTEDG